MVADANDATNRGGPWAAPVALGIALLAGATAFAAAAGQSFWIDEVSSVVFAGRVGSAPGEFLAFIAASDVHPPLYYAVLGGVLELRAALLPALSVEAMGRLLSAAFLAVAVFGTARLGARLAGWRTGLLSAVAVGFLPIVLHYGAEARMYALALALFVWASDTALGLLERPRAGTTCGVALLFAAAALTHYALVFGLAALTVAALLAGGGTARGRRRLAGAAATAGLLAGPWVPAVFFQLLDLPAGFSAHLAHGPTPLTVLAALSPGAALPTFPARLTAGLLWALALAGAAGVVVVRARVAAPADSDRVLPAPRPWARLRWPLILAAAAGLLVGPALLGALLPLPESIAARFVHHLPATFAALAVAVGGAFLVERLGRRQDDTPPRPLSTVALAWFGLAVLMGLLALTRPFLSVRNTLVLVPWGVVVLGGVVARALRPAGLRRLRAAVVAAVLATSTAGAASWCAAPDRLIARPDLRGVAAALRTPAAVAPVGVLPAWEVPGIAHYAPELDLAGFDLGTDLPAALRAQPQPRFVLGRWAAPLAAIYRESLARGLGDAYHECDETRVRGFVIVTFCR